MDKLVSPIARAAPQMKEGTSNANHETSAGSMTSDDQVTAKIDGGLDFDEATTKLHAGMGRASR